MLKKCYVSLLVLGISFAVWGAGSVTAQSLMYPPEPSPYGMTPQYLQPVQPTYPSNPCGQNYGRGYESNSAECMYQAALHLVYARRYYEAIASFDQFLRYYPYSSLADNALYWTGESYYAMKQYSVALAYFQRIEYQYPRGNKMPDSLLKQALSYFSLRQTANGCYKLNELMQRYPRSESARKGMCYLGRCGGGYYQMPYSSACAPAQSYAPAYNDNYNSAPSYGYEDPNMMPYYGDAGFPKNY